MKKSAVNKAQRCGAEFAGFFASLNQAQKQEVSEFFGEIGCRCLMPRNHRRAIQKDFEAALLYYQSKEVPLETALERLAAKNMGGFYARPPMRWYPLDDAAKIYPLSMKEGQMAVFRLSAYLKQPVIPELLQIALTFTIKRFPSFATTVKKGAFWHYLDTAKRRFCIEPDNGAPCLPLRVGRSGSQTFRVMYYNNRISAEFFHVLTDGTGGLCFLKTLTGEYLRLCGIDFPRAEGVLDVNDVPSAGETENAFCRAEKSEKASGFVDKPAVQMSGRLSRSKPCRVLSFRISAPDLQTTAKSRGASVTAYLLAQIFLAMRYASDETGGEMSVQVPVNMRKFYPSDTLRNFALYCGIRLPTTDIVSLDAILPKISEQLLEKASKSAMSEMLNSTERMVRALRFIPLCVKTPVARLVYGFLGDGIFSNTLSNLGIVRLPEGMAEHIDRFDFVLGTAITNRAGCAAITFGNTATLSISKTTLDPSFEEKLYELLTGDGLEISAEGSEVYES